MASGKGRTIALGTAALGLLVLAAAGFASKDLLLEEWHLRKLRTGGDEEKRAAAERLGELGSLRAVPLLLEVLNRTGPWYMLIKTGGGESAFVFTHSFSADEIPVIGVAGVAPTNGILNVESGALPYILETLGEDPCSGALALIAERRPEAALPLLVEALEDEKDSDASRVWASILLARLGPRARSAIAALERTRGSGSETLRYFCAEALSKMRVE